MATYIERERRFIVYNKGTRYVDGLVPFGVKEIKEFMEQGKNIRSFVCRGAGKLSRRIERPLGETTVALEAKERYLRRYLGQGNACELLS